MKKFLIAVAVVAMVALAVPAIAATNPFMDVPASHWAYDAVAQLASRGVISGYPDGSYKGAQPATRYEMASVVARALAKVDMEKASKQDLELLKKLVLEFKDELDALGVKVDKIDERLKVIEKDLGGWSLAGQLRFDARFAQDSDKEWYDDDVTYPGDNEFDLNQYRIWLKKRIDENTNFTARIGSRGGNDAKRNMTWDQYYVTTKLPYDIKMTVGRAPFDWEDDLGLYNDNDAWFGDWTLNMFRFEKDWGVANLKLVIARANDDGDIIPTVPTSGIEHFLIAGLANFNFTEQFRGGLMAYYFFADEEVPVAVGSLVESDTDLGTYGAYLAFAFTPAIELKGLYYYQTQGDTIARAMSGRAVGFDDTANAWKVMLDVKQEAFKFTSLWLEYGQMDNNFVSNEHLDSGLVPGFEAAGYGAVVYSGLGASLLANMPLNMNTSKIYGGSANQQWNDKWRTYLRYYAVDFDTTGIDNATNWTVGVGYQYTPAISFELAYDKIDYGDRNPAGFRNGDDNAIRFRTFVKF